MNALYPIIRRQRRPFLAAAAVPPVILGNVEPVQPVPLLPAEPVVTESEAKASDAKPVSKRKAR